MHSCIHVGIQVLIISADIHVLFITGQIFKPALLIVTNVFVNPLCNLLSHRHWEKGDGEKTQIL